MPGETVVIALPSSAGVTQAEMELAISREFERRIAKTISELGGEGRGIEREVAEYQSAVAMNGYSDERARVLLNVVKHSAAVILELVNAADQFRYGRDAVSLGAQELLLPDKPQLAQVI